MRTAAVLGADADAPDGRAIQILKLSMAASGRLRQPVAGVAVGTAAFLVVAALLPFVLIDAPPGIFDFSGVLAPVVKSTIARSVDGRPMLRSIAYGAHSETSAMLDFRMTATFSW